MRDRNKASIQTRMRYLLASYINYISTHPSLFRLLPAVNAPLNGSHISSTFTKSPEEILQRVISFLDATSLCNLNVVRREIKNSSYLENMITARGMPQHLGIGESKGTQCAALMESMIDAGECKFVADFKSLKRKWADIRKSYSLTVKISELCVFGMVFVVIAALIIQMFGPKLGITRDRVILPVGGGILLVLLTVLFGRQYLGNSSNEFKQLHTKMLEIKQSLLQAARAPVPAPVPVPARDSDSAFVP